MKLCHIAALVTVSWYLIMPPGSAPPGTNGARLMTEAPLSQWFQHGSFDTAKECYQTRQTWALSILKQIADFTKQEECSPDKPMRQCPGTKHLFGRYAAVYASQCVASDDPRLKEH